jgi:Family of unknown function (DUF5670)
LSRAFDTEHASSERARCLDATVIVQRPFASWNELLRGGGDMLFKIAFALLMVWLLGVVGLYNAGDFVHVLLLVGLMSLLLAFLRGREAVVRRERRPS